MTTAPHWSSVDEDTASLLSLVANDQMTDHADREWAFFERALRFAGVADDGQINPNTLRAIVRGHVAPKRVGAFTRRALLEGLIRWDGEWVVSDDHEGRNAGRPAKQYRLAS